MELIVLPDEDAMATAAADVVAAIMRSRVRPVLGLAAGRSPQGLYADLVQRVRRGALTFATTSVFHLDEYLGLPAGDPHAYGIELARTLLDHIDIPAGNVHLIDARTSDLDVVCAAYEREIAAAGGIDLQVLGLGRNGHLGFNEPGTPHDARTRVVELDPVTRAANSRFFARPDQVPTRAITMGIGTILEAERLLLLALGPTKADALAAALRGPVSADVPASVVQLHPDVTVIVDRHAAARST